MDKKELAHQIYLRDKEFQRKKLIRQLLAMLYHAGVMFVFFLGVANVGMEGGLSFDLIMLLIAISLFCSFFALFINLSIYGNIFVKGREEQEILDSMIKRCKEMEQVEDETSV